VLAKIYNSSGVPIAKGEFFVNTTKENLEATSKIVALDDGTFVVTWASLAQDGSGNNAYFQRFNATTGDMIGVETRIATAVAGDQAGAKAAAIPGGGFMVVYQSPDANQSGIFQKYYDSQNREMIMLDPSKVGGTAAVTLYASDPISESLSQIKVRISSGYQANQDVLVFNGKSVGQILTDYGITATWDSVAGTMTLTGNTTAAKYNTVLGLLQYDNTLDATALSGDRVISITGIVDLAGNTTNTSTDLVVRVAMPVVVQASASVGVEALHWIDANPTSSIIGTDSHYDIALMMGADQTIDLGQLSSVEKIDLTGIGANKLTVDLADVLQITTGNTALQNANMALKIVGDMGDTVDLVNSVNDHWSKTGQITNAGEVFNVYHNDATTNLLVDLWIREQVQVNVV
jgi:hypothetical protein